MCLRKGLMVTAYAASLALGLFQLQAQGWDLRALAAETARLESDATALGISQACARVAVKLSTTLGDITGGSQVLYGGLPADSLAETRAPAGSRGSPQVTDQPTAHETLHCTCAGSSDGCEPGSLVQARPHSGPQAGRRLNLHRHRPRRLLTPAWQTRVCDPAAQLASTGIACSVTDRRRHAWFSKPAASPWFSGPAAGPGPVALMSHWDFRNHTG